MNVEPTYNLNRVTFSTKESMLRWLLGECDAPVFLTLSHAGSCQWAIISMSRPFPNSGVFWFWLVVHFNLHEIIFFTNFFTILLINETFLTKIAENVLQKTFYYSAKLWKSFPQNVALHEFSDFVFLLYLYEGLDVFSNSKLDETCAVFNPFSADPYSVNYLCGWQGDNGVFSCTSVFNIMVLKRTLLGVT